VLAKQRIQQHKSRFQKPPPIKRLVGVGSRKPVNRRFDPPPAFVTLFLLPRYRQNGTGVLLGPELPAQPKHARRTHPFAAGVQSGKALERALAWVELQAQQHAIGQNHPAALTASVVVAL